MITGGYKLSGHLVKWALKKKNGRYIEHDCDIHNTITKSCLNNMFEFNGPGSTIGNDYNANNYCAGNLFVTCSGTNLRYGILNSCALGNGIGTTSVNDIALKNQVGDYTATKKTGDGWSGYTQIYADNIDKVRIGHIHTINDNFTIKEIGWFNRIYPDGAYSLSARVQLDEFVDVEVGDTFYTVYELVIHLAMPHIVTLPYLGKAIALGRVYGRTPSSNFPLIDINGQGMGVVGSMYSDMQANYPAYTFTCTSQYVKFHNMVKYTTTDNANVINLAAYLYFTECSKSNISVEPYTQDSFYRDFSFEIPAIGTDVYTFVFNNTIYRLGEYDENDTFVPNPFDGSKALKIKIRQRISTDLLTPTA